MEENNLVGTWRLVSWENHAADGTITYPMGEDVRGYILYNPDGYMSVVVNKANRPAFVSGDFGGGTEEERARAAATCVAYSGRYEVRSGHVLHHVELSLFPNWVGTTQERFYELQGSTLTLSTAPILYGGHERSVNLVWQRAQDASGGSQ